MLRPTCRYMVKGQEEGQLRSLTLRQFVHSVGARTAAPGGGSVSAAIAALVGSSQSSDGVHIQVLIVILRFTCRGRRWGPWWGR